MTKNGLKAIPELVSVILSSVMQAERSNYVQVNAYERTEERKGQANGYKPKTVMSKLSDITFPIPQVREGGFYPSTLKKGMRSERALVIALAEMYVQGVSTRRVKASIQERATNSMITPSIEKHTRGQSMTIYGLNRKMGILIMPIHDLLVRKI